MQIYTITYHTEQPTEYENYFNKINSVAEKSYLFEYNVFIDIVDNYPIQSNLVGVFSWKFPYKTQIFKKKLEWIVKNNPSYEIYNLCTLKFKNKYLAFTESVHPGFMAIFKELCKDLNLPSYEPKNIIYSNFFLAKSEIYKEFVNDIIKPAIVLLETKYKKQVWNNSNYKGLSKEQLKEFTGLDYYPFHTFLLERLFGQWLETKNYKIYNYKN